VTLPQAVLVEVRRDHGLPMEPPGMGPAEGIWQSKRGTGSPGAHAAPGTIPAGDSWQSSSAHPPPPPPFPAVLVRTSPPTRYWVPKKAKRSSLNALGSTSA